MTDDKGFEIKFAPGCFDGFDGTQEELEELIEGLKAMAADGSIFELAEPVTEETFEEMPEELKERLSSWFGAEDDFDLDKETEDRLKRLN